MDENYKEQFIKLTYFLGEVLGPKYEIVFHVVSDKGIYIAAIANNNISGRNLNSPLTSFASELIQNKVYTNKDYLTDYKAFVGKSKILNGSTFFIKNVDKLVGILCINYDSSEIRAVVNKIIELEKLNGFNDILNLDANNNIKEEKCDKVEILSCTIEDILSETIDLKSLKLGFSLSIEQKEDIISILYNKGIFNIKGSISIVAKYLKISEPSVYRYLQKLKKALI